MSRRSGIVPSPWVPSGATRPPGGRSFVSPAGAPGSSSPDPKESPCRRGSRPAPAPRPRPAHGRLRRRVPRLAQGVRRRDATACACRCGRSRSPAASRRCASTTPAAPRRRRARGAAGAPRRLDPRARRRGGGRAHLPPARPAAPPSEMPESPAPPDAARHRLRHPDALRPPRRGHAGDGVRRPARGDGPGAGARRGGARPRHHPGQRQPPRARADDHRPRASR